MLCVCVPVSVWYFLCHCSQSHLIKIELTVYRYPYIDTRFKFIVVRKLFQDMTEQKDVSYFFPVNRPDIDYNCTG